MDIDQETIDHVNLVQVTRQELTIEEVIGYDRLESGHTHEAPNTLQ